MVPPPPLGNPALIPPLMDSTKGLHSSVIKSHCRKDLNKMEITMLNEETKVYDVSATKERVLDRACALHMPCAAVRSAVFSGHVRTVVPSPVGAVGLPSGYDVRVTLWFSGLIAEAHGVRNGFLVLFSECVRSNTQRLPTTLLIIDLHVHKHYRDESWIFHREWDYDSKRGLFYSPF